MPGFDVLGPFDQIKAMLALCQGVQQVYEGTPKAGERRVVAWLAFVGAEFSHFATGGESGTGYPMVATLRYFGGIGYAVRDAAPEAERGMAVASMDLGNRFYANKTAAAPAALLNGTVTSMDIESSGATEPLYVRLNEEEFRVAAHLIAVKQRRTDL